LYALLFERNGGSPMPRRFFNFDPPNTLVFLELDRLLSIYPRGEPPFAASPLDDLAAVDAMLRQIEVTGELDGYLTFATVEEDHYLLIGLDGERAGRVYLFAPHWIDRILELADTLPKLLFRLTEHPAVEPSPIR
jgi:hypothetical protein